MVRFGIWRPASYNVKPIHSRATARQLTSTDWHRLDPPVCYVAPVISLVDSHKFHHCATWRFLIRENNCHLVKYNKLLFLAVVFALNTVFPLILSNSILLLSLCTVQMWLILYSSHRRLTLAFATFGIQERAPLRTNPWQIIFLSL